MKGCLVYGLVGNLPIVILQPIIAGACIIGGLGTFISQVRFFCRWGSAAAWAESSFPFAADHESQDLRDQQPHGPTAMADGGFHRFTKPPEALVVFDDLE